MKTKFKSLIATTVVSVAALSGAGIAHAGAIISAVSATIDAGGPGSGSIADTYNQNGLFTTYTSGVTDFNTYIGSNPIHTLVFAGNEWFSNPASSSATVTYSLGSVVSIDRLALWNEDYSGIGTLNILGSTDGVSFSTILSGLNPTDNANDVNYGAEVFAFGATAVQYVRLEMSNCPQIPQGYDACAIGEVAFRQADGRVPEPAGVGLLGLGLLALTRVIRNRRKIA